MGMGYGGIPIKHTLVLTGLARWDVALQQGYLRVLEL